MAVSTQQETLIDERQDQMVSPTGGKPSLTIAHFLKPSFPISEQTLFNPRPLFIPITLNLESLSSKVDFQGWTLPHRKWNSWVDKLRPLYESTWRKSSIYEPILASTLEIPRCNDSIFALAQKWCPETNSFLLPWGEFTITLEDIMVLGGYSVTGDSVFRKIYSMEFLKIKEDLLVVWLEIITTKSKETQEQWMDMWMENGRKFEHEAFLFLWLSRYVFPCDSLGTINKGVFQFAILLARGTKIALAPAVLASIYRDLRLLKEKIMNLGAQNDGNSTKLSLWAPLQLMQVWVWERFPTLSPNPNAIPHGFPRLARWHKVEILRIDDVGLAIDLEKDSFSWRPYSTPLNNWTFCTKLYPENSGWVSINSAVDLDFESYARCVRISELVGLDCIEQYLPHRVSMQFGLDQDIPMDIPRLNDTPEIAWSNYNRPIGDVKLYMPSRLFESDVTIRYLEWLKKLNYEKEDVKPSSCQCQAGLKRSMEFEERLRRKLEINQAEFPPGFDPKCKKSRSNSSGGSPNRPCIKIESNESDACPRISNSESPLSSVGIEPSVSPRRGFTMEDGIESKSGSPVKILVNTNEKEVGTTSYAAVECTELDLEDRIARLQRIVNAVKSATIGQLRKENGRSPGS